MSEVSLRDYLARLDQLAQAGSADEVLWHARHILQYYPKNVDAYRFIGRALVALGRWDEANATLRRVLSVLPNDKTTHLLLSTAYERQKRPSEAIWHLERAFEQDPNDAYLVDELKRMYREFRHIANPRIQFTTAAVARQNIRSRDFDRAIEALRAALKRTPQRGDLRLLLAEALWQRGNTIDAAETALDVLQTYPDSLDANRMLASLWLSEQRPSDARRHLNRVEAVDPYLALELVQGLPADNSSFVLPELDYQRRVQAEMVAARPDWLENIDLPLTQDDQSTSAVETSDLLERAFQDYDSASLQMPSRSDAANDESNQSDEDWLSQLDSIEMSYQLNTSALQSSTSPLSPEAEMEEHEGDLPDLAPVTTDDDGSFAFDWSDDAGLLTDDTPSAVAPASVSLAGDTIEFDADEHPEEDPFGWMSASTLGNQTSQSSDRKGDSEPEDPLAWLRSSGIEVVDNAPTASAALQELEDIVYEDPETASEADPLNWLKDYGPEVIDAREKEASAAVTGQAPDDAESDSSQLNPPFDQDFEDEFPMPDLDMIVDDWSEGPTPPNTLGSSHPTQTMPLTNLGAANDLDDEFANPLDEWELNERLLNESLGLEALADTPSRAEEEPWNTQGEFSSLLDSMPQQPPTAPLPAISDEDWAALEQARTSAPSSSEELTMSDSQRPDLGWDDEAPKEPADESTGATGMLDWLNKNKDAAPSEGEEDIVPSDDTPTGSTGILSWLAQGDNPSYDVSSQQVHTSDDPTGSTGILNWLSQNRPVPPTVPLGQASTDETEYSTENLNIPETPEWLGDLQSDDRIASATQAETGATEILDWLGDVEVPTGTTPLGEPRSSAEVLPPDTDWLQEMYQDAQTQREDLPATGEITWDEDGDWKPEEPTDLPHEEWTATGARPDLPLTEPLVDTEVPLTGELNAFQPTANTEDSIAALSDWLQSEPQEASSMMAEASVSDWEPVAALEDEGAFGTRPLDNSDDDSFAALADWLQTGDLNEDGQAATGEAPIAIDASAMADRPFMALDEAGDDQADSFLSEPPSEDWLSQEAPLNFDPLEEEPPVDSTPFAAEAEPVSETEEEEAVTEEAQAEAVMIDEGAPVAPESNLESEGDEFATSLLDSGESQMLPDWMGDVTGESTTAEAFSVETLSVDQVDDEAWLEEAGADSEVAEQPETTPDWLLAAAPIAATGVVASVLDQPDEEEPQIQSEGAWDFEVAEVSEADALPEPEATTVMTTEEPIEPAYIEGDNEFFSAFEDLPASEAAVTDSASNAPDWLNAMVPGLDIDTTVGATSIEDVLDEEISEETADAVAELPDDHGWLDELVEEETQSDIIVPAVAAQAPRFVFSRPPRWLRRLIERRDSAAPTQDDGDLPAWLR